MLLHPPLPKRLFPFLYQILDLAHLHTNGLTHVISNFRSFKVFCINTGISSISRKLRISSSPLKAAQMVSSMHWKAAFLSGSSCAQSGFDSNTPSQLGCCLVAGFPGTLLAKWFVMVLGHGVQWLGEHGMLVSMLPLACDLSSRMPSFCLPLTMGTLRYLGGWPRGWLTGSNFSRVAHIAHACSTHIAVQLRPAVVEDMRSRVSPSTSERECFLYDLV